MLAPSDLFRFMPTCLALIGGVGAWAGVASGQCQGEWIPGQPFPGVNGRVAALTTWTPSPGQPEVLVAGGSFSIAGDQPAANIALWDGLSWRALPAGVNGAVNALAVRNGDLYAAGAFTSSSVAGGPALNKVARWDGAAWQPLSTGIVGSGVNALSVRGTDLFVAGAFTSAGGVAASNIARWDGSQWAALGTGVNNTILSLGAYNSNLVAVGGFTQAGGNPAGRVAVWNGSSWAAFGSGLSGSYSCTAQVGTTLYVGGVAGDFLTRVLMVWNGVSWFNVGAPTNGTPRVLLADGGSLYIGGAGSTNVSNNPNNISRYNGTLFTDASGGVSADVASMALFQGSVYAGGTFSDPGNQLFQPNWYISRWNGSAWTEVGHGADSRASAVAALGNDLLLGGTFNNIGGVHAKNVARWDGAAWHPLGGGLNDQVFALGTYQGEVIAGGFFTFSGSTAVPYVGRFDGASWRALGGGANASVRAFVEFNGRMVIGGDFSMIGGAAIRGIAAWDGFGWSPFAEGLGGCKALAVHNGELYAGGGFYSSGATTLRYVARWDGAAWQPLGAGLNDEVTSLASWNGSLAVGGKFSNTGRSLTAAWDGTSWRQLGGLSDFVYALTTYNSELYAAGAFGVGIAVNHHIARFDGSAWQPMSTGLNGDGLALGVCRGELIAAGNFRTAGGLPSSAWARWSKDAPVLLSQPAGVLICAPSAASFSIIAGNVGAGPGTYRWRRNSMPLADGPTGHGSTIVGSGATTLLIQSAGALDAGAYDCVVTGSCGATTSQPATLAACPADFDCSGTLAAVDIFAFLAAWFAGDARADFDGSGGLSVQDIFSYLSAWFDGC